MDIAQSSRRVLLGCLLGSMAHAGEGPELALAPGTAIEALTPSGRIVIEAIDKVTRRYSWGSHSKTFELSPRPMRWMGSKGAYRPTGDRDTHVSLEEGQQHFYSEPEAYAWLAWLDQRMRWTYSSDGLVVGWYETKAPPPQRNALIAEVWQFYIRGKKPEGLKGSSDERIRITRTSPQEPAIGSQGSSQPARLGDREFSGKAIDLMKEFKISAVDVEDVIARAKKVPHGDFFCYVGWTLRPIIKLSVCTDSSGKAWLVGP